MSNPLKKTMVYLGLADDDLTYAEQQNASAGQNAPEAAAHEAPAPVAAPTAPAAAAAAPVAPARAAVTPLRRPTVTKQSAPSELSEILTVHPKQYKDAQVIAETFREGVPVIINLSEMSDADARRLIDFSSGLSQGLGGKIERVTNKVFLLSPAHVAILGDTTAEMTGADGTFFAQQ